MHIVCLMLYLMVVVITSGQSDFEALLELKKAIDNDPSEELLVSWDSNSLASDGCPQNWYGVICVEGRVISITLNNLGLIGNFSFPVLTGLKMLRNLSIPNNQFTGTISNVGSLESLKFLDLSCNLFHGFMPSGLFKLKNLVLLNLSSNNFEGGIPSGFGNLESLKYLDMSMNSFSGDISNLLLQSGSVIHVDLSGNKFNGSLDLGLGDSSFISSIQYLNVSHNALAGELFAHDGTPYFDSLEVFDASYNHLVGEIPAFKFVVSLKILRLGSNLLSGSLPQALLQESSTVLSELDLSLNQLEGPLGSISSATLKKLNLSSNKLSGPLPTTIGHCAIIDLSNNMFSGNVSRIQNWGNYVEVIQLSSNALVGSLPQQTSQFLRLTSLRISNNSLDGDLPAVLSNYSELQVIDLSHNSLSGVLLPSLFSSVTLSDMNLSNNNLTASIPLQDIQAANRNLSLVSIDLSHNSLDGNLPPEISGFHYLEYIDLSNNKLQGNIPGDLPDGLKRFNISSNNLSGTVPDNLKRFPDSAFRPGNPLLILTNLSATPNGSPDHMSRKHQYHMTPAVKTALIAGMIAAASAIAILCMLIYYRSRREKHDGTCLKGDEKNDTVRQESSHIPAKSASNKTVDPTLSAFSFNQNTSPQSHKRSEYDTGNTSSIQQNTKKFPEEMKKDEALTSPLSFLSSSNTSPSKSQISSDNLGVLKVCSPDKLAGDLHLFDDSVVFTAEELSNAPADAIGRSCHGTLYRATLDSGNVLAVKWLKEGIVKGKKEFAREVKKLGNIRHPNLLSILGYYWGPKEHEKMILSKYKNAHCLAFYLQDAEQRKVHPLSLVERLRIAVNVARCLNYLHNERAIPHGNLKSSNILLEHPSMNPLISDYSLHRLLTSSGTAEQVLNAGALGYRPPEFASSSKPCPSLKSDVYAFGVILLELLTGRSSGEIVSAEPGVIDLTDWVRFLAEENRFIECFDEQLLDRPNVDPPTVLSQILHVALTCMLPASDRPDMKSVFEDLLHITSKSSL